MKIDSYFHKKKLQPFDLECNFQRAIYVIIDFNIKIHITNRGYQRFSHIDLLSMCQTSNCRCIFLLYYFLFGYYCSKRSLHEYFRHCHISIEFCVRINTNVVFHISNYYSDLFYSLLNKMISSNVYIFYTIFIIFFFFQKKKNIKSEKNQQYFVDEIDWEIQK